MFEKDEERAERELKDMMAAAGQQEEEETDEESEESVVSEETEDDGTLEEEGEEQEGEQEKAEDQAKEVDPEEPQRSESEEAYKQRYLTLQGMLRAERKRHKQEVEDLNAQIEQYRNSVPATDDDFDVDEDYISPHVSDVVRRSPAYKRMESFNGKRYTELHFESLAMMSQPQQAEQQAASGPGPEFFTALNSLAPQWRRLNDDPAFLKFLSQIVPYSGGMTFQDKLDAAVSESDAATAAQFFIDYEETNVRSKTKTTESRPKEGQEQLIAPSRRSSAAQAAADTHKGKVYTEKEWNDAWERLAQGKMSAKAAQELEADLTKAPSEGRVVPR